MKPAPKIEPYAVPIPEPLLRASDEAGRRKQVALDRLMIKLDVGGRTAELEQMIDADKERER